MIKFILYFPIFAQSLYLNQINKKVIQNNKIYNKLNNGYDYLKYLENLEIGYFNDTKTNYLQNLEKLNNVNHIEYCTNINQTAKLNEFQYLYNAIICTSIISLIDTRLKLLRTNNFSSNNRQIYTDTINIYIPLAHIFGLDYYIEELGNLSLIHLSPEKFYEFQNHILNFKLSQKLIEMTDFFKLIFTHKTESRVKSIYSAWEKNNNINEISDLIAIRIIINSNLYTLELQEDIQECYRVFHIISHCFNVYRIKDYIQNPKTNGYKSIHTTILLDNNIPLEIQIRTSKMDHFAKYGTASYYKYKKKII